MSERNGHARHGGLPDPFVMNAVQEYVKNSFLARSQFLDRYMDGRRDIDAECNYPKGEFLEIDLYRALYAREAVAERVVQVWPKECWQVQPNVYEDEDPKVTTPFEQAFNDLGKKLLNSGGQSFYEPEGGSPGGNPLWSYLCRADILSGIGTFGVLLLGLDDGKLLEEPVDGIPPDGNPNLWKVSAPNPTTPQEPAASPQSEPLEAPQVTNPSQAGPTVPGSRSTQPPDDQLQSSDLLSKDIYGGMTQEQKLSSTMGTDAQYFGTQFTPTSYHGGNPLSPMRGGGYYPKSVGADNPEYPPSDEFAPGDDQLPQRQLLFLRCFDESLVQVVQYEADIRNPRFGQPLMYLIVLNDPNQPHTGVGLPLASVRVHWSRVIHLADNLRNSQIFGVPRMQPVINRLLDLRKLYGGSAEGYWKGALPVISLETNPQLGGDVNIDRGQIGSMMYSIMNSLQRYMTLTGMTAKTLAPQVADPTPQIAAQIEAICIEIGCPVRVFKGSERGELASSQDDSQWNDRLRHRQQTYITPSILVPFVDRLILINVLPQPKDGYKIEWPDLDSQTDVQKAQILLQKTQAYAAYETGQVGNLIQPLDYLTHVDDMDPELAKSITDSAEQQHQQEQEQAQALADQHGFQPEPPEGFKHPAPPPELPAPVKLKDGEKLVQPPTNPQQPNQPPQKPSSPKQAQKNDDTTENYNSDEPRDDQGRWTAGGSNKKPTIAELAEHADGEGDYVVVYQNAGNDRRWSAVRLPSEERAESFKEFLRKDHTVKPETIDGGRIPQPRKRRRKTTENTMSTTVLGNTRFLVGNSATGRVLVFHGGAGSGDFSHAGRPGERGGSAPGKGGGPEGESAKSSGKEEEDDEGPGATPEQWQHAIKMWSELHQKDLAKGKAGKEEGEEEEEEDYGLGAKTVGNINETHHVQEVMDALGKMAKKGLKPSTIAGVTGALGGIAGSLVAERIEKSLGLDKKTREIYAKMKNEFGEAAPYVSAAAHTAAIAARIFASNFMSGLGVVKAGAEAVSEGMLGEVGEHVVEAVADHLGEGTSAFLAFGAPGLTWACHMAAYQLGKHVIPHLRQTKGAQAAGRVAKKLRESRPVQYAKGFMGHLEKHLENFTHANVRGEIKHAGGEIKGAGKAAFRVAKAGARVAGGLVQRMRAEREQQQPAPAHNVDPSSQELPSVQGPALDMMTEMVVAIVDGLKKNGLWDKLNSPAGQQYVRMMLNISKQGAGAV